MNTNELMGNLKPFTLALVLAFGVGTITAMAEDVAQPARDTGQLNSAATVDASDNTPYVTPIENATNTDWMSPLAAEFVKLDKTGNGLLLPYEASKDKAFNKKTFAKADVNKDGYIDQSEYTQFKTGKLPDEQANINSVEQGQMALTEQESVVQNPTDQQSNNLASESESNRTVGAVVDDSVITAKAKAKILATKQLKSLQISVETRNGEVLLSGLVDTQAAKTRAEQVVSQIAGVKSVRNTLEVKG